ncbi:hypothetical protein LTR36_003765 [Oleoguttula mirabilis]|uniref:F-box domain-containing protein n=1 Tax=Oleoguttula mirabilis TaxID=1507867 RepID=A0AAV9JHX3_9PEZI|nr:hypothetical protein LTR36_003765 [Oleoguttula mirabilis]
MSLDEIPPELLEHIASFLDPLALGNLRLTAQDVHDKTFHDYTRRVLDQRWLLTREESLRTLMEVANDSRFREKLTDLHIDTHTLSEWDDSLLDLGVHLTKPERLEAWRHFVRFYREQDQYINCERPAAMLTLSMAKLPALRSIEVGEWCSQIPVDGSNKIGWGGKRIERLTKQYLNPYEFGDPPDDDDIDEDDEQLWNSMGSVYTENLTFHFSTLLTALSVAQHPIEQLSVGRWRFDDVESVEELHGVDITNVQSLHQHGPLHQGLRVAFRALKSLRLALQYDNLGDEAEDEYFLWLPDFVSLAPELEHVALWFDGRGSRFLPAITPIAFARFAEELRLEHLASLELHNLILESDRLHQLLQRHTRTLKRTTLQRVSFSPHVASALDVAVSPVQNMDNDTTWVQIIDVLHEASLSYLRLACLYDARGERVTFKESTGICATCERNNERIENMLCQIDCEHISFTSEHGNTPDMIFTGR